MVVWDGLRKLNGYQGSDVRCLNRCVMEAICQRNLPELNIAVLMVKAIYFMPGDLGSRTLRIAYPSNGVPLGSRTLGSTWDRVPLGSRTLRRRPLGMAYPWDGVPLGWHALRMVYPLDGVPLEWHTYPWDGERGPVVRQEYLLKKLAKYITSPSSWRSRSISYPGPWNGVRGPDVRQHYLLKRLVKIPEHRCSNS